MENAIIERAKAHFAELAPEPLEVEIPEWKLNFFITPMNVVEKQKIFSAINEKGALYGYVEALILKAKDANGEHLFSIKDRSTLLQDVDPDVITQVGPVIMNFGKVDGSDLGESSPDADPQAT